MTVEEMKQAPTEFNDPNKEKMMVIESIDHVLLVLGHTFPFVAFLQNRGWVNIVQINKKGK